MARQSFVSVFVRLSAATQFSGFAGTATADSDTAAMPAAPKPDADSGAAPTTDISEARKESSIIVTDNEDTAIAAPA